MKSNILSKKQLRKLGKDTVEDEPQEKNDEPQEKTNETNMFQKSKTGWPDFVWLKGTSYDCMTKDNRKSMNLNIQVPNFDLYVGKGQMLLENAEINIQYGKKYGIIGRNGIGKSVLLRAIINREDPFSFIPSWFNILHVEQEITGDERPPLDFLLSSDRERLWLLNEAKRLEKLETDREDDPEMEYDPEYDLTDIYERLREIEAHKAESRASSILAGLQFNENEMRTKQSKDYSGGWRMRLSLARALFLTPELLILDEPTNHLDLHASIWLENYLKNYRKTLLLVSHDESILDDCVDNILYFSNKKLYRYKGNYSSFLKTKEQNDSRISKKKNKNEVKLKKIKESAQKNRGSKLGARKKDEVTKYKTKETQETSFEKEPRFKFPEVVGQQETAVLKFDDVSYSYKENDDVVKSLSFGIYMDSRIALVGANGTGKSTIMKLMSGELLPTFGSLVRSNQLRIVKYDQHAEEKLDLESTCIEWIQRNSQESEGKECRKILGRFGIQGDTATQKIGTLSGGQKSRLVFAVLTLQKPHLMLLDEPTNHLDLFSIKALIEGLKEYRGGLVIISHNQKILSECCDQTWVVHNNKVTKYEGSFEEYKDSIVRHFDE